jgi:hypothetical protein
MRAEVTQVANATVWDDLLQYRFAVSLTIDLEKRNFTFIF